MSQTDKKWGNLPIKAVVLVFESANAMAVTSPGCQMWMVSIYTCYFSGWDLFCLYFCLRYVKKENTIEKKKQS